MHTARLRFILLSTAPVWAALLLLFIAVGWALYTSFTDFALLGRAARDPQWVGLKNYLKLLRDASFLNSLDVSLKFTIGSAVLGQLSLGLLLAVLLKRRDVSSIVKGATIVAVTFAWVIPDIVAVYVWGAFTAPSGLLNTILGLLGLPPQRWLSRDLALETVIIANIWRGTAFSMILFSSALETVPKELYEAADVDGASGWQRFRLITLPLITPAILIDLILITLWTFGYFTLVFGLTGGGPGKATEIMPVFIYNRAFGFYEIGYGAALSFVMMVIVGLFCLIYLVLLRRAERMT
jgi:multiple sugar transport system permease protein